MKLILLFYDEIYYSKSMYVEVDLQQGPVYRISQTIVNNELCSYLLLKNPAQMCDPVHGTLLCSN